MMPNFAIGFPDEGFECPICVGVDGKTKTLFSIRVAYTFSIGNV